MKRIKQVTFSHVCKACTYSQPVRLQVGGKVGGQRVYCSSCEKGRMYLPTEVEEIANKGDGGDVTIRITEFVICDCNACGGAMVNLKGQEVVA